MRKLISPYFDNILYPSTPIDLANLIAYPLYPHLSGGHDQLFDQFLFPLLISFISYMTYIFNQI